MKPVKPTLIDVKFELNIYNSTERKGGIATMLIMS
jgi:hypothetical protein